jgi:hypothetical protein
MRNRQSGIILRLNLAMRWGYLASADRRSTHPFHFEQVEGYDPSKPFPMESGQAIWYRVDGLRVTEVVERVEAGVADGSRVGVSVANQLPF